MYRCGRVGFRVEMSDFAGIRTKLTDKLARDDLERRTVALFVHSIRRVAANASLR